MADLSAASTALLVMDVQTSIVARYAPKSEAMLQILRGVIAASRKHGIRVIYVIVAFRPGHPEVSGANKLFGFIKQSGDLIGEAVHSAVAPLAHEPVDPRTARRAERSHKIRHTPERSRPGQPFSKS
jgi:nicotinamidase-related amidase